MIGIITCYANNTYSQTTRLSLSLKNKTVKDAFSEIEKNSEYVFLYHDENLDIKRKVTIDVHDQPIEKVLDNLFKGTDNIYFISNRQVFISKSKETLEQLKQQQVEQQKPDQRITITGTITDRTGEPLIGVTIKPKSNRPIGTVSGLSGEFIIYVNSMDETLIFTYVGMQEKELKLKKGTTTYKVVMENSNTELGSVVVEGGIITRDKLGFTGAYHTIGQDELKAVGNMNIIQTLKTLDPAFVVMDNVLQGSNPNIMATIELRGKTGLNLTSVQDESAVNPNQPLFILDGFEASIQEITDLDMNRVQSVTLLKDAGSTAIYGAKGANGVVVIETIRPKSGEIQVIYNGDFQLGWADLSQYNLMNSKEKLEFEKQANFFGDITNPNNVGGVDKYNNIRKKIEEGVDTYWLKMPIRTALTHNNSLTLSGGSDIWQFTAGLNYRSYQGIMKESSRESFSGNVRITYRGSNNLNISNNLTVGGVKGHDGSWGSFADFAKANPYYTPYDEYGTLMRFLDTRKWMDNYSKEQETEEAANPLYNSSLLTYGDTKNFYVTNNTTLDWFIRPDLRFVGNLSLKRTFDDSYSFTDPRHTKFSNVDYTKKGVYNEGHTPSWRYNANASLSYNKSLIEAHNLTLIGRTAVEEINRTSSTFVAEGFPEGAEGIPSFAYSYKESSRPSYSYNKSRTASFLLAFNYNYKFRYLFDFNINSEGSTTFGRNNKFDQFWSVGTGWNIHKEEFAKEWKWLDDLKIRGTYGTNANQLVNTTTSTVYGYYAGSDLFGTASKLDILGNPNLKWMKVKKTGVGIDGAFFNNRLKFTADIYRSKTNPMSVPITQKASTGTGSYSVNLGNMVTKGYEFMVSYSPIYNTAKRIFLNIRVTGGGNKSTYGGFTNALNNLNNTLFNGDDKTIETMLQKYQDGNSPDDLWAVRSLGIDPSTGREIFLTIDGTPTYVYDANDRVKIANRNPKIQGIFGLTFTYDKLQVNVNFRYQLGSRQFNSALFNKVENISNGELLYNQDKRALYDRWKNPGDKALFKGIDLNNYSTPMSDRFIQKNDIFKAESAKISWDFSRDNWIKTFGLRDLRIGISSKDLFYISSIKTERGIDYPFERGVSLNITCSF